MRSWFAIHQHDNDIMSDLLWR